MVQEKLVSSEKTKNDNNVYHDEPELRFEKFDESWKEYCLEDCVIFLDNERKPLKESDRADKKGKYPYYGASGIIDYIDDYIFDDELILMGEDGANIITRSSRLVFLAKGKFWVNNHAHVFKAKQNFDSYFLAESLERINYEKYNTGTAQPKLNQEVCAKIKFKLPNIDEQKRISIFLQHIDKKIELLEKKYNEKLIFKEEFFNKYISSLSKETQKIKLNNLIKILNDRNKNNDDLEVLSISNKLGFISQEKQFEDRIVASSDTKNYKIVKKGYFAYNPARINVGSIARLKNYDEGIISPMYIVFKINEDLINPIFFENYLSTNYFKLEILKRLEGSVRLILSAESLKNIEIFIPPLDEQDKISSFMITLTKSLELSKIELDNFKEFKKGLLQKMFV